VVAIPPERLKTHERRHLTTHGRRADDPEAAAAPARSSRVFMVSG
jgi:hypothetical protein